MYSNGDIQIDYCWYDLETSMHWYKCDKNKKS